MPSFLVKYAPIEESVKAIKQYRCLPTFAFFSVVIFTISATSMNCDNNCYS